MKLLVEPREFLWFCGNVELLHLAIKLAGCSKIFSAQVRCRQRGGRGFQRGDDFHGFEIGVAVMHRHFCAHIALVGDHAFCFQLTNCLADRYDADLEFVGKSRQD